MVFPSTLRLHATLAALVALPLVSATHWIFGGTRPVVTTRLDPIVSPGALGSHVHSVAGASGFGPTYDYDTLTQSQCTTVVVPQDKSNYWTPSLYYYDQNNKSFTAMPNSFNIYYLVRNDPSEKVQAIPKGLKMLAGDPNRRVNNASNFADQAVSYVCLDYSGSHNNDPDWAERPDFFPHNCPNGMRAQVFFPACWDGVNLDSSDHKSHMAYPTTAYNTGLCPSSHPVHLVSIFYEMIISVDQFPYNGAGTWVWSNGDTSGLGFHGDFTNGWMDIGLLQNAIDNCPNAAGNVADCPPLAAVMDTQAASACLYEGQIVNEDIGDKHPIPALPGCNAIWTGTGPKPACPPSAAAAPTLESTQQTLAAGWTNIGCIAEGTNGRALTGASYVDAQAMTLNTCAAFCGSKGFTYAGIEWSQECYCGNTFSNGASKTTVSADQCSNACAGNQYETCGGPQRLTLLFNPTPGQTPVSSAAPSSAPSSAPVAVSSVQASSSVAPVSSAAPSSASPVSSPAPSSAPPSSQAPASTPSSTPQTSNVLVPSAPVSATPSSTPAEATPSPSSSVAALPIPSGLPAGWAPTGCANDSSHRTLNQWAAAGDIVTVSYCVAQCNQRGFQLAGLEYGRECYCGNTFLNNGGAALPDSTCSMKCNDGSPCGGDWALNVFQKVNTTPHRRSLKSSHHARHYGHNTF